jgi:hypothetical protein
MRGRIKVDQPMNINELTGDVIAAAIEAHKILGPALLELFHPV